MPEVAFDKSTTLYRALYYRNTCYVESKMNDGWPGIVKLRLGFRWWHIRPELQQGVMPAAGLRCGKKQILGRSNEMEPSEWKDAQDNVLATDVFALENGKIVPRTELNKDLTPAWRELMLALWVSRLWAGYRARSGRSQVLIPFP
jgi:hypothetical protein